MLQPDKNGARIELGHVTLGTGLLLPSDFRKALRTCRIAVSDEADKMLDQIVVADALNEAEPVIFSVRELGYERAPLEHILARGLERGLQLCTSEFAPQMCIQHKKTLPKEHLHIAMDPVPVNTTWLGEKLEICSSVIHVILRIQGKLWLSTAPGMLNVNYPGKCKFVFINPRK